MFESWQDMALTAANLVSLFAALPSIMSDKKPAVWTSGITTGTLTTFAVVYISLDLLVSGLAAAFCAVTWAVLWYQSWQQTRHHG